MVASLHKYNENHDEQGRFGFTGQVHIPKDPNPKRPPRSLTDLLQKVNIHGRDVYHQTPNVKEIVLAKSGEEALKLGMPLRANGMTHSSTRVIVLSKDLADPVETVLRKGMVSSAEDLDAMQVLNHEVLHLTGASDSIYYQQPEGRALEEGLTEGVSELTTVKWVESLGIQIYPPLKELYTDKSNGSTSVGSSYPDEVLAVTQLAEGLSKLGGKPYVSYLETWKNDTVPRERIPLITKQFAEARGLSTTDSSLAIMQRDLKVALGSGSNAPRKVRTWIKDDFKGKK
jgi:hypothetical protein